MRTAFMSVLLCVMVIVLGSTAAAGDLAVKASYVGPGEVTESHPIHIFIFNVPPSPGVTPIAWDKVTENGAGKSFSLTIESVYVAVMYDAQGGYDPNIAQPPSGSPISIYSADGQGPTLIKVADVPEVTIKFDNTNKMP